MPFSVLFLVMILMRQFGLSARSSKLQAWSWGLCLACFNENKDQIIHSLVG